MGQTIRVSLPGVDAGTATDIDGYALYADEDNVLIKEKSRGTIGVDYLGNGTVNHNLGYIPFYLVYAGVSSGRYRIASGYDPLGSGWRSFSSTADLFIQNRDGTAGTIVQYYIFYDNPS